VTRSGSPQVAFCGLGRMGREMAGRIAAAGFPLTVWNRSGDAAWAFARSASATAAASPAAAARHADVLVTMLTDGAAVLRVLDGPDGALAGLRPGGTLVDCSTTGPEAAREAARLCEQHRVDFLDCPVSGSTAVAAKGELGLMVGGDEAVLERVRPVLDTFSRTVVHVGSTGAGAAAKVAVNGLLHTFSAALAESLVAAEAEGVARERLFDVLAAGVLANRFVDYKREAFLQPLAAPVAFDLTTATKDLDLAAAASQRAGIANSVIDRTRELHHAAVADGFGARDIAALTSWFGRGSGRVEDAGTAASTETLERT